MTPFTLVEPTAGGGISYYEVRRIVDSVTRGGLVLLASDTGFSLAGKPFSARTRDQIDTIRGDPDAMYPLAFGSVRQLEAYADLDAVEVAALTQLCPGPLSLVVDVGSFDGSDRIADALRTPGTVAARLTDSRVETELATALDHPVTTCALRYPDGRIVQDFDDALELALDGMSRLDAPGSLTAIAGAPTYPEQSTIARVDYEWPSSLMVTVLREGHFDAREIKAAARNVWLDIDTT